MMDSVRQLFSGATDERIDGFLFFLVLYSVYLFMVLWRRASSRDLVTPKIICSSVQIQPENPMAMIAISGRRGGLIGWFLRLNGAGQTYEMHVSSKLVTLKTPSSFDESHAVLPVNRITMVACNYHVPLRYMIHFMAGGMLLFLRHGFAVVPLSLLLGFMYAVACSSMQLAISTGEGFWGFRYVIGTNESKETVFRLLHTLRLLLVRTQDKIPMPLPPPAAGYGPVAPPHAPHAPHAPMAMPLLPGSPVVPVGTSPGPLPVAPVGSSPVSPPVSPAV